MTQIILCEKGSQARNLKKALGDQYGRILAAEGHLLVLQEPEDIKPEWEHWSCDLLLPDRGFYGYKRTKNPKRRKLLSSIETALKSASSVIVATDNDREGQSIADELLTFFKYKGETKRALFNAEDPKSLREAFADLRPNSEMATQYHSALARQQTDQIYGLSMTRAGTTLLRAKGWPGKKAVGFGRVKTPTLGMICRREVDIQDFTPQTYFDLTARLTTEDHQKIDLQYRPAESDRLFDHAEAEEICVKARNTRTSLLVKTERKKQEAPKPLDLPTLQKRCSTLWKWTAKKALGVAQTLYSDRQVLTYPRAETRYLPENMIDDAEPLRAALTRLDAFKCYALKEAIIRTGKTGVFSDKDREGVSHHAIIPNVNASDKFVDALQVMSADEKKLFLLVAQHFLASIGEPHVYDRTEISCELAGKLFSTAGRVTISPGWRSLFGAEALKPGEEEKSPLSPVSNGTMATVDACKPVEKITQPPPRYTDGSLISAMRDVWKLVADPELRQILKEAKGIGTVATRDTVIDQLKAQGFVSSTKSGELSPTESAMTIYRLLEAKSSDIFDPVRTALLEKTLDDVVTGQIRFAAVVRMLAEQTSAHIEILQSTFGGPSAPSFGTGRAPSAKMLALARNLSDQNNVALPEDVETSFDACKAFLDAHTSTKDGGNQPKQPRLASAKQTTFIQALIEEGKLSGASVDFETLTAAQARELIDFATNANRSRSRRAS